MPMSEFVQYAVSNHCILACSIALILLVTIEREAFA
jgi:hypothetical protein